MHAYATCTTAKTLPTASPRCTDLHVSCTDQAQQEYASWCRFGASWCKKGVLDLRNCTKATRTCTELTYMLTKQSLINVVVPVPTPTCTKSYQTDGNVCPQHTAPRSNVHEMNEKLYQERTELGHRFGPKLANESRDSNHLPAVIQQPGTK